MTKTVKRIIAVVSALAVCAGLAVGGWAIGRIVGSASGEVYGENIKASGGAVFGRGDGGVIALASEKIEPEDYAMYGVNSLAETATTITVVPDPVLAIDTYTWTCTNTEQITLSPSGDTKSCVVTCTGPFTTQATITVASELNSELTGTVTVDYVKRVTSVEVTTSNGGFKFGGSSATDNVITVTPQYGDGTLTPEFAVEGGNISVSEDAMHYLTTEVTTKGSNLQSLTNYTGLRAIVGGFDFTGTTVSLSTPSSQFITDITQFKQGNPLPVKYPSNQTLYTAFDNSFVSVYSSAAGHKGVIEINYRCTYSDGIVDTDDFDSGTQTISTEITFDVSAIPVKALSFTTDTPGLLL